MDTYVTEEQQVEAIKHWWQENGISVIVGIVMGLAIVFGWRAWDDWHAGQTETAAMFYQRVMVGLRKNDQLVVQQAGSQLMESYTSSVYAILGGLAQATLLLEKGDTASARGRLEWVITQAVEPHLTALAQLRLGRLLLDQGDPTRALTLAGAVAQAGFLGEADELRGDVLRAQGDRQGARSAYQAALTKFPADAGVTTHLRLKLDDLGDAG